MNTTATVCLIGYGKWKTLPAAASIVKRYFKNVKVVAFNPDESEGHDVAFEKRRREAVRKHLDSLEYDYLISYWNFLFLREKDFQKAKLGAINFHPCPPEHPGLACFVYPLLFPEKRKHHGVTVHEVNAKLDDGKIYRTVRFPLGDERTGPELLSWLLLL